jgi:hypothetical protein
MPIREAHTLRLLRDLDDHERQLAQLRQDQIRLNTEVCVHKTVLALGRDERVHAFIRQFADDDQLVQRIAHSPRAVLEEIGVTIPQWMEVKLVAPPTRGIRATFSVNGSRFFASWDEASGFTAGGDDL